MPLEIPGSRFEVQALSRLIGAERPDLETKRLCEVCAEVTMMSGAGIMLMSGDMPRGSVCTTNPVSARLEELQFSLGEGPCVDAHNLGAPVLEPDLADPRVSRWLGQGAAFGVSLFGIEARFQRALAVC